MLSIGELSKISHVTVKSIRYYHELGLLEPVMIDPENNYRYFDRDSYEKLCRILTLKDLGFTLSEIGVVFEQCKNEEELQIFISKKIEQLHVKVKGLQEMEKQLKKISSEISAPAPFVSDDIFEHLLSVPFYAAVTLSGSYEDSGRGYREIYKSAGKYVTGYPFLLSYDMEYTKKRPNIEAALELIQPLTTSAFSLGQIKSRKAVSLLYKGPYGGQGETYIKLFDYCREKNYEIEPPIIEKYIKGPGMIFKGNPEKYITECTVLVKE